MISRKVWSQVLLLFLGALALAGVAWLLLAARPLLNALLVAMLLAYLLDPVVRWAMVRFQQPRPLAATLVYSTTLFLFVGLLIVLGATIWGQINRLETELHQALGEIQRWLGEPLILLGFSFDLTPLLASLEDPAGNALAKLDLGSSTILSSVSSNLLWSLVVAVSLYYFLKDGPNLKPWLISLLPNAYQQEGERLISQVDMVWGVFLRMQLLIFAILAALVAASSLLIIWLYRLGWLPLSPLGLTLLLLAVYAAIQQLDNLWLRPQLIGRKLQLHPSLVIVGLIAALALSGVLAAIVIVPLMATIKIIAGYTHAKLLGRHPLENAHFMGGAGQFRQTPLIGQEMDT